MGLIPDWETKILPVVQQNKKTTPLPLPTQKNPSNAHLCSISEAEQNDEHREVWNQLFGFASMPVKSLHRIRLCDCMDLSLPGFSVHGILQARILEWLSRLPPRNLLNPGIKPVSLTSPALSGGFFTTSAIWEALFGFTWI